MAISAETVVHRIGGGQVANLRLSLLDRQETPPGISVLLGGTPQEAATLMRQGFPKSRKWQSASQTVGSSTVAKIQGTGFDVMEDSTNRFSNHGRLIHPQGEAGFTDDALEMLANTFQDTTGC